MSKSSIILYWQKGEITVSIDNRRIGSFNPQEEAPVLLKEIDTCLQKNAPEKVAYVLCPGGVLKPLKKACYVINERSAGDARTGRYGRHKYNLLTELTYEIGTKYNVLPVMFYPMSSDELLPLNRITSNANVRKYSRYHAFEHHIGLVRVSKILEKRIEEMNCIIAYMEDITSVGAYERGICLDVNDSIGAEGPMGFTSSGDVPVAQLAEYFIENKCTYEDMQNKLLNESGILQYTGINNVETLDMKYQEDENIRIACEAMAYQTAKWIGSSAVVLRGRVDAVVLTGKGGYSEVITDLIKTRIEKIAPVFVIKDLKAEEYLSEQAGLLDTYACPIYEY